MLKKILPVAALLALICLLVACTVAPGGSVETGSSADTPPESAPMTLSPAPSPDTGTDALPPDFTLPDETLPYDPDDHPGDPSAYRGLHISAVHGTGKKGAEAVVSHGFVQISNSTDKAISLSGAALYYKTSDANQYTALAFPADASVPAGGSYLVRANAPRDIVESNLILRVESADLEWDIHLDNKEVRLLLAPVDWRIERDADITRFDDAVSVFVATEAYHRSVYAVNDLSRNKIAVRTALKDYSGYHLVNLTRTNTADLRAVAPRTSGGVAATVVASRLTEVLFSHDAGIYDQSLSLTLSAEEGYTIFYTTDGSDPKSSSTRQRYEAPISLADTSAMAIGPMNNAWYRPSASTLPGGHVIKAYATNGFTLSEVYTNTYFITDDLAAYGVTILSFSIPKAEMLDKGFYSNYLPNGAGITDQRPRGTGILEVFDPTGRRVGHSRVEMAVSGNGSSGVGMKSLRVYYKGVNNTDGGLHSDLNYDLFDGRARDDRGQAITSFSRLLLRNSGNDVGHSYVRDAYMQRVSAGLWVDTMASASTLVFVNGEFWGVYNARERYSPEYVESHYGVAKENVTLIESDYSKVHTDQNAPFVVSSGEPGDADPFNAMVDYMRTHDLSVAENYAYIESLMDVDSFIDLWVSRLYFNARDFPENNIKVWRNKNPDDPSGMDTKWHFVLLDTDMGLSYFPRQDGNNSSENANYFWFFSSNSVTGTIMRSLMQNEGFKNRFITRFYELITEHYTVDYLSHELELLIAERDRLMPLQASRWYMEGASVATWQSDCADMRDFISNRYGYVLSFFLGHFGISESDIEGLTHKRISVSYHTGRADVTVNGEAVTNGNILRVENGETVTWHIVATPKEGCTVLGITYTDRNGQTQRTTGTEATFRISESGTLTVLTQKEGKAEDYSKGSLVAGATSLFYLTEGGDLYAWGDNRYGALGIGGAPSAVSTPTYVMSGVSKVATASANAYENGDTTFATAILTADGRVLTVGRNTAGQLGRDGTADSSTLAEIDWKGGRIVDVSMGHDHLLILDESGVLWGVGSNAYGALGPQNVGGNVTAFTRIATGVSTMSAGRRSTVFLGTDGRLWGVGDNRWHKMSLSHGEQIHEPVVLASDIAFIDSGEHQVLAVDKSGRLTYAGWRTVQGFGQGGGNNPVFAPLMSGVRKADIYFGNAVILTTGGDAYIYGLNTEGGLGEAITGGTPKKTVSGVNDVAAGYGFTAYLMADGRLLIRGDNTYGQAGNGAVGGQVNLAEVMFPD